MGFAIIIIIDVLCAHLGNGKGETGGRVYGLYCDGAVGIYPMYGG